MNRLFFMLLVTVFCCNVSLGQDKPPVELFEGAIEKLRLQALEQKNQIETTFDTDVQTLKSELLQNLERQRLEAMNSDKLETAIQIRKLKSEVEEWKITIERVFRYLDASKTPIPNEPDANAAKLSKVFAKRLEFAGITYDQAVQKAENVRSVAVQKATQDRTMALKAALADATKAGDFEAASIIMARLNSNDSTGSSKPKNVFKFYGHDYALIEQDVTWHVAKGICEKMGGHLATLENQQESESLLAICKATKHGPWIGATDEQREGKWLWVTGEPVTISFHQENYLGLQHHLDFAPSLNTWDDGSAGERRPFFCEWEK